MTVLDRGLLAGVLLLLCVDVWHNFRIARAYGAMGRLTSKSLALTAASKRGFSEFFPLCGFGTHGMHTVHVVVDAAVVSILVLSGSGPEARNLTVSVLLLLFGASVLHWKQADAAESVVEAFFVGDLSVIEEAVLSGLIQIPFMGDGASEGT